MNIQAVPNQCGPKVTGELKVSLHGLQGCSKLVALETYSIALTRNLQAKTGTIEGKGGRGRISMEEHPNRPPIRKLPVIPVTGPPITSG